MSDRERRRIVLLSSYPADHSSFSGGVETATAALVEGLSGTSDFDVHVVATAVRDDDLHERRGGVSFHFLAGPRSRWVRPRFPYRAARTARFLRRLRPHLVHCHDTIVLAPAALAGPWVKVFSVHGIKRGEARFRTGWERASASLEVLVDGLVRRGFDAVVCNSRYARGAARARGRVFEVPNAVSRDFLGVTRSPSDEGRFLFVGALTPLKRPLDLVEAHLTLVPSRPGLRTSICGPVEDARYVEALRRRTAADPSVVWEGLAPRARILELLSDATALVLPSLQENVPMVIAEAMAAGVPVVAARVGGVEEMVEHGVTGLLYRAGDTEGLRAHLAALLDDPALAQRMGAAARAVAAERYSPESVARATTSVYHRLLDGGT